MTCWFLRGKFANVPGEPISTWWRGGAKDLTPISFVQCGEHRMGPRRKSRLSVSVPLVLWSPNPTSSERPCLGLRHQPDCISPFSFWSVSLYGKLLVMLRDTDFFPHFFSFGWDGIHHFNHLKTGNLEVFHIAYKTVQL